MEKDLKLACAIAEALTKGKSVEEIVRLHATLQAVCSLLSAELSYLKNKASGTVPNGSPSQ